MQQFAPEARHPVCEGGNVSTVARSMCFSPRSKGVVYAATSSGLREKCPFFPCMLTAATRSQVRRSSFGLQKNSPGLCEAIFIAFQAFLSRQILPHLSWQTCVAKFPLFPARQPPNPYIKLFCSEILRSMLVGRFAEKTGNGSV